MNEDSEGTVDRTLTKYIPDEAIHEVIGMLEKFILDHKYKEDIESELEEELSELAYEIAIHLNDATVVMRFGS